MALKHVSLILLSGNAFCIVYICFFKNVCLVICLVFVIIVCVNSCNLLFIILYMFYI